MTEDEQVGTGSRRPWVTPAMIEEDCAATETGDSGFPGDPDQITGYDSGA